MSKYLQVRDELMRIAKIEEPIERMDKTYKWFSDHVLAFSQVHIINGLVIERGRYGGEFEKSVKYQMYHEIAQMMMDVKVGHLSEEYRVPKQLGGDLHLKLEMWVIK